MKGAFKSVLPIPVPELSSLQEVYIQLRRDKERNKTSSSSCYCYNVYNKAQVRLQDGWLLHGMHDW